MEGNRVIDLIHVRFDLICSSNREADRELFRADLPQVPNPGETVSVKGYPYIVITRGWSVNDGEYAEDKHRLYAYLRVAHLFPLTTDGKVPITAR